MLVSGMTNKGMERARNEDCCFFNSDSQIAIMAVADGMGGHQAGNVASGLAVSSAEQFWGTINQTSLPPAKEIQKSIRKLLLDANELILNEATASPERRGMGTTFTVGLIYDSHLTIGHIGDSRAYLIKDGRVSLLTRDHSLVEELIKYDQVKPEEVKNHPQRHVLTRALGIASDPDIDIIEQKIEPGSVILFCTDGLTNMVGDEEILEASRLQPDPMLLSKSLIDMANERGGFDNITVLVATEFGGNQTQ